MLLRVAERSCGAGQVVPEPGESWGRLDPTRLHTGPSGAWCTASVNPGTRQTLTFETTNEVDGATSGFWVRQEAEKPESTEHMNNSSALE